MTMTTIVPVKVGKNLSPERLDEMVEWLRACLNIEGNSFGEMKLTCNI